MTTRLDTFTLAYLEAALWLGMDDRTGASESDPSLDLRGDYDENSLTPEAKRQIHEDCAAFQADHATLIGSEADRAGADFYLTRNGHGTGFWDRPEVYGAANAKALTEASRPYGEFTLMLQDDGKVGAM